MSLLDHLVNPLYSYGLKYKVNFRDRVNNLITLHISKKNYNGAVENLVLGESKLVIKKNFIDEDFFVPIAGTQIELTLISDTLSYYLEFAQGTNVDFFVEVFKNQKIYAFGYLLPDTYQEDGWFHPFVTKISTTDHLGFLKDFKFEYAEPNTTNWTIRDLQITGVERASDIITFILNRCFLKEGLVWWDLIPVIPKDSLYSDWGCLYNIFFECYDFIGQTCEEVLITILKKFNCRIVQHSNGYIIQSPDERTYSKGVEYYWNGSINDIEVVFSNVYKVGGSQSVDIDARVTGRVNTSVQKAANKLIFKVVREEKEELPFNAYYSGDNPVVWDFGIGNTTRDEPYFKIISPTFIEADSVDYTRIDVACFKLSFDLFCYSTFIHDYYGGGNTVPIYFIRTLFPPEPFKLEYLIRLFYKIEETSEWYVYHDLILSDEEYINEKIDEYGFPYLNFFDYNYGKWYYRKPVVQKVTVSSYENWESITAQFKASSRLNTYYKWIKFTFRIDFYRYYNPDDNNNYTTFPAGVGAIWSYINELNALIKNVKIKSDVLKMDENLSVYNKVLMEYKKDIIFNTEFNKTAEVEKSLVLGNTNYFNFINSSSFYTTKNVFLTKSNDLEFNIVSDRYGIGLKYFIFIENGAVVQPSYTDYLISKYVWYYSKNKMKVSFSIAGIENENYITPFTWFILRELGDTACYVLSYSYDMLNYIINVEVLFDIYEWILLHGIWNDGGIWLDNEYWIDSEDDFIPFFERLLNS